MFPGISTQPHMYTHRSIQPSVPGDQHKVTHVHSQVHPTLCSQGSAHSHTCTLTGSPNPVFLGISTQPHMYTHRITQPSVPGTHHTATHVHSQVHPYRCFRGSAHNHTCALTGPSNPVFPGISTQPHMYTHRSIQPGVPRDEHTATHVHSQVHPTRCSQGSAHSHTCTLTGPSNSVFLGIIIQLHMYVHSQIHPTQCTWGSAHSHTCTLTGPSNPVFLEISTQSHMYTHRSIQHGAPGDQHTVTHEYSQVHSTRCSQHTATHVHSQVYPTRCS